jgi:hypothetical protein
MKQRRGRLAANSTDPARTGRVTTPGGQWAEIVDGEWTSPFPLLLETLEAMFPTTADPAEGSPGSKALMDAAKLFSVDVEWYPRREDDRTLEVY